MSMANAARWLVLLLLIVCTLWIVFEDNDSDVNTADSSDELIIQRDNEKVQLESIEAAIENDVSLDVEEKSLLFAKAKVEPLIIKGDIDESTDVMLSTQQWSHQKLLASWGIDYSGVENNACEVAEHNGLLCFSGVGDISLLQRLNRPVIIKNRVSQQEVSYLFVKSVEQGEAIVLDQSGEYRISWLEIANSWQGEFELLWKPLANIRHIRPGMEGGFVKDIDQSLSIIFNRSPSWNDVMRYDVSLVKEVKSFQRSQKISADGVIGPLTQIYMNNLVGADAPRLRR